MTQRNWLGHTGAWSDPTQWDTGLPGTADTASFNSGTYSVDFATTASLAAILAGPGSGVALDIASGLMMLGGNGANSNWGADINQAGGTVVVQSGSFRLTGALTQTGGVFSLGLGAHLVEPGGSATFGGELAGMGELDVGGTVTLSGIIHIGAISMGSTGLIQVGSNELYAGALIPNFGSLALEGNQLILTGHDNFGDTRIIAPGTIAIEGIADLPATAMVGTDGTMFDAGTVTMDGPFVLGSSTTDRDTLVVDPGATFDILVDAAIDSDDNGTIDSGSILNEGLFEKGAGVTASGVFTNVQAPLTNNGTLRVAYGTLLLSGGGSRLAGTVDGAGTLLVGAAGGVTLDPTVVFGALLTVAVGFGATLALGGGSGNSFSPAADIQETASNSAIALQGNSLTLQGAGALDGTILAPGSLYVAGVYHLNDMVMTGGTAYLEDKGLMIQDGIVELGNAAGDKVSFLIDAGAVYDIDAAPSGTSDNLYTFNNGTTLDALILNNGLFEVTGNGGGLVPIDALFENNTTGTVVVARGTVAWRQGIVNDGFGTIDGDAIFGGGIQASSGAANVGTLSIGATGTIDVTGTVNTASTIDFSGAGGQLIVRSPALFNGVLDHFSAGDSVDFVNVRANELEAAGPDVSLSEVVNGATATVASFGAANSSGTLVITGDGNGGTKLLAVAPTNVFGILPTAPVPAVSWLPGGTLSGSWFAGSLWTGGVAPTVGTVDATVASAGGTIFYNGGATVDALNASGTTLDMTAGSLEINNGGGWTGIINQADGVIDSVTGFAISSAQYDLEPDARLESDSGTVTVQGTFLAQGTLAGDGAIAQTLGTLVAYPAASGRGGVISVATLAVTAATFVPYSDETIGAGTDLALTASTMPLFNSTITLAGSAQLYATVPDTGTIIVTGTADDSNLVMSGTNDALLVQGKVVETSTNFDATSTTSLLGIAAGATFEVPGDPAPFAGSIVSAGLFEKTGGSGQTHLEDPFSSTGEVDVDSGTLWLDSPNVELGGTVSGSGMLFGFGNDVMTLDAGLFINVATWSVSGVVLAGDLGYGGVFASTGNVLLQGHTLTLSDTAELTGSITGPGVVNVTHSGDLGGVAGLTIQGNGVTINADGVVPVTQSNNLALGGTSTDQVTLAIPAGHTYDLLTDSQIGGNFSGTISGTIANAGVFEKLGGGSSSAIYAALDNTGSVIVQHGTLALNTAALNDGRFVVNGVLAVNAPLTADAGDSGTLEMTPIGTLLANALIAASQTIVFDPGGLIVVSDAADFHAVVTDFEPGDTLELPGLAANGVTYANNELTLTNTVGANTSTIAVLNLPGVVTPGSIALGNDPSGSLLVAEMACFAEGTWIATVRGPVAVEELRVGDLAACPSGRLERLRWIGHRHVDCRGHPRSENVRPVRVAAGAFGAAQPLRTLRLSPDHAVYVDGILVPVRYLINGVTVTQEDVDTVTYWHLELGRHDVLLAEGLPAESYLDTGNRQAFPPATVAAFG